MTSPRAFSHLGVAVDDIERAVAFYTEVLGLYLLHEPIETDEERDGEGTVARILTAVYGPGWGSLWAARLVTADGRGIELQQFAGTTAPRAPASTATPGMSHFCVLDPDVQGLADRVVAHGGRQLTEVREFYPGRKPFALAYCADPFGNLVEIDSHPFETTYSPVSYPEQP